MAGLTALVLAVGLAQAPAPPSESPTQFYQRYLATVSSATSMDDITLPWTPEAAAEYRAAPLDHRVNFADMKRMSRMVRARHT